MIFRGFTSSKTIVMKESNPLHDDQLDNNKKVFISIEEEAFQEHLTGTCVFANPYNVNARLITVIQGRSSHKKMFFSNFLQIISYFNVKYYAYLWLLWIRMQLNGNNRIINNQMNCGLAIKQVSRLISGLNNNDINLLISISFDCSISTFY